MWKRLISVCIFLIMVCGICGCAQSTEGIPIAEPENVETVHIKTGDEEGTDAKDAESESVETEEETDTEAAEPESEEAAGSEEEDSQSEKEEVSEDEETDVPEKEMYVNTAVGIKDITWEQVEYNVVNVHFIFEDTVVDREIVGNSVQDIVYEDITGDGIDEALIYCRFANNICDWQLVYFYQINNGNVMDISPSSEDIPELAHDEWGLWNMWIAAETMTGYSSPVYELSGNYYKEEGITYTGEILYIGYRNGKWEIVQGFN